MELFEKASRAKLRFETSKGNLTVEDLWVLPLSSGRNPSLDGIAISLNKAIKETQEESFVATKSTGDTRTVLAFEVVKHIIAVRIQENDTKLVAVKDKARKERILGLIADKEDDILKSHDIEELKKLL
jgi:hypothetical protein